MKPKTNLSKNLSLSIVALTAAVSTMVFDLAIARVAAETIDSGSTPLIAQLWSDVSLEQLSLDTSSTSSTTTPQHQIDEFTIAQLWTDVSLEQLSLTLEADSTTADSQINEYAITQLPLSQQQLIAQLWTDVNLEQLTLIELEENLATALADSLITQLPSQQQLIAQLWQALNLQQLRLAAETSRANHKPIIVARLPVAQQQLLAQLWSDLDHRQLSLSATTVLPALQTIEQDNPAQPQLLIAKIEFNSRPKLVERDWTDLEQPKLGWESPTDEFDSLAILLNPDSVAPPPVHVPSKQEIAARIILDKVQIISPAPGVVLDGVSNSSVTVRYPASASVKLAINGKQIDDSKVTREDIDFRTELVTQTWSNTELLAGHNQVSVIARNGGFDSEITREVLVRDEDAELNVIAEAETDAKTSPAPPNQTQSAPNESKSTISDRSTDSFVKILTPKADAVLEGISSTVIVQYPEEASAILQVNGKSVNPAQVGRTAVNPINKIVTQTWYGIIFERGSNDLTLLSTIDGTNYTEKAIQVFVPDQPKALKVQTIESHIPADGNSVATVQGEFIDAQGKAAFWNGVVTLNSSEGQFVGNDYAPDQAGFQVKAEKGKFSAALQAGYDAENVTIQAKSGELEAFTRMQFKSTLRSQPLLTGFAELRIGARGTNYHDRFQDFFPLDEDNGTEIDFTSAAFIEGSFGRWSYRGAFNSDRPLNEDSRGENRLFRTYSSSESSYPIYGDSSTSEVVAPSTDQLYLRFERSSKIEFAEPDYLMWGDYNTEEFATESQEFSSISRQLHGFKSNYNLGNFQLNGFYANNAEGFQRDSLAPDGTSGFYFLSRRLIIPGSEDIYLELSPLNDPGNTLERQRLSLGLDYEIDYDRGTLLFKEPILSTDVDAQGNILVRRIVTTYQFESETKDATLFAGRGRFHFNRDLNHPSWLGMTYLNEDRGDLDFSLFGFDSFISLGNWGSIEGEYASSDNQTVFDDASGAAYRLEGEVNFNRDLRGRAYYRQAESGFANNASLSFVPGQTRYGTELNAQIFQGSELRFSYERQNNDGVAPRALNELEDFLNPTDTPVPGSRFDNNLTTISAGVKQRLGEAQLETDLVWRDRQDNNISGTLDSTSAQLQSRFSIPIINKLNFHALSDLTLSEDTDTVFSDRLGVGLDWEFYSGLSLVLNHQWFTRGSEAGNALTTLGLQGEYTPWKNAMLTGRYSVTNGVAGINNTGSVGLQQKIPLAAGLDLDLDYERTFSDLDRNSTGSTFIQPFAVGQGASALSFGSGSSYGVGLSYTDSPDFTANAKFQYSDRSGGGSNTVISAGVTGKLSRALTSLFSYNQASSANQTFDIGTTRNIRLGLAYRDPQQDKFNALLRYEYEENGGLIPETILLDSGTGSQDHLFAGEVIYAPSWRWEFYSKLAFRNSRTFLADDFVDSSNISLGQFRTTYRLNYHVDLVGEARGIWQPSADYTETGFLLEAGYYLTPELRLSAGYVFGRADDQDFTGTRSAGGPYFGMTMKLNSILDGFGQHNAPSLPKGIAEQERREDRETGSRGSKGVEGAEEQGSRGDRETGGQGVGEQKIRESKESRRVEKRGEQEGD